MEDNIETLKIKLRQKYNANQGAPTKRPTTADHVHKATEVRQREANKSKNKVPPPSTTNSTTYSLPTPLAATTLHDQ